jgi:hypothetical protein
MQCGYFVSLGAAGMFALNACRDRPEGKISLLTSIQSELFDTTLENCRLILKDAGPPSPAPAVCVRTRPQRDHTSWGLFHDFMPIVLSSLKPMDGKMTVPQQPPAYF